MALNFPNTPANGDTFGQWTWLASTGAWVLTGAAGTGGDVTGPGSVASNDNIAVYNGTTGKVIKDGLKKVSDLATTSNAAFTGTFGWTGTTATFAGTVTFNTGFSYFAYGAPAVYPAVGTSLAVSWNFSGGIGEVDLWNTYAGTPTSTQFRFYGLTGVGSANLLLEIGGSAVGLNAPYGITTTTQAAGDNSTKVATTAFVAAALAGIPHSVKTNPYTCVLADAGKMLQMVSGAFTIPANASVAYPVGTTLTFCAFGGAVTIAITTDTMYLAGTAGTTGTRNLANTGIATAVKTATSQWVISGSGLT